MSDAGDLAAIVTAVGALVLGLLGHRRQTQSERAAKEAAQEQQRAALTAAPYGDIVANVARLTARTDELEKRDDKRREQVAVLIRRDTLWRQWAEDTRTSCRPYHAPADLPTLPSIPKED